MDLSNRYLYLFTCLILSIVCSISSVYAATGTNFTYVLDKQNKAIKLENIFKDGKQYNPTSISVNRSVVASSMKKRLATGGGSLILLAAAYYGMQYNQDNGVFEKQAESGQWKWTYLGLTSSSPSAIANAVVDANNANQSQFTYSAPTTRINGSGALTVDATRTDKSSGATKQVTLAGIGGTPNTIPPSTEIYSLDQVSEALINDAFAIEGSDYFPSADQVTKAGQALLDLYGIVQGAAIQQIIGISNDATSAAKDLYAALTATQPVSQETDIKAPAVPDNGVIGSLPDFCSWATPVCDALSKLSSLFQTYTAADCPTGDYTCLGGENPIQTTDLIQPDGVGLDGTMFNESSAQCPADEVIPLSFFGDKSFSFSYSPMCSFAIAVNPIVVLIGYLVAGYMFINSLRTM
jgi:hypothetical protein